MHFSPLFIARRSPGAQWLPAAEETCRRVRKWRNAERRRQPLPAALPPPVPYRTVPCRAVPCHVLCCAVPLPPLPAAPSPHAARAQHRTRPPAPLPPARPEPRTADPQPQPRPGSPAPSSPPRVPQLHRLHSAADGRSLPAARRPHSSIAAPRRFRPPPEVAALAQRRAARDGARRRSAPRRQR